jgi:AcrR family transcriptional regulator
MRDIAQREDIRDLILDSVDVLLARYGYSKMTVEDIAQQTGIGKGTIYLHFSSKEELTLSHIDRIIDRLLTQLRSIAASESSPQDRVKKMLIARVMVRFESVRNYSESLNDLLSSLRSPLMLRRRIHFEEEAEIFAQVLDEGQDRGLFQVKNPYEAAETLIWATNSFLPYSLTPKELGKRKEIEERVSRIADLLLHGLTARVKEKSRSAL